MKKWKFLSVDRFLLFVVRKKVNLWFVFVVLFENQDVKLEVNMKDETVWLNANQMSELFGRDSKTIRKHIDNALKEELDNSTVANFATVELYNFFQLLQILQ